METNNNEMTELEQMREQMTIFKNQLDKQPIVNEQLVRNTMGSKMSWIKKFIWGEIIIVPILLIYMAAIHAGMGLSWWLFAFLAIGVIADITGDFIINRIPKGQLLGGDLVATCQRLIKMKKQRASWFIAGVIFCTVWLVWFLIDFVMKTGNGGTLPNHNATVPIVVGAVVGGLIGAIIAWLIFRKMQRTNTQLIDQINQITQESQD